MSRPNRLDDSVSRAFSVWRRWLLLVFAAIAFLVGSTSAAAQVLVVLSDGAGGYNAVADELRAGLKLARDGRVRVDSVDAAHLTGVAEPVFHAYELIVPVGLAAAQAVVAREASGMVPPPTLCLLIPRQSFERLAPAAANDRMRHVSALYIDQPVSRQLDLLRIALPERHRVGVILGPSSQELEGGLRSQAQSRELSLNFARVGASSGIYAALQDVMPDSDLLLLVPDPVATTADSVYGLLLTSYRAQIPVVGYSEGLLNAGALMSLYSTARQQGRQGAEIATSILAHEPLPDPQHPKYFTVRVNASVARSLGLHLPAEAALSSALEGKADKVEARPDRGSKDGATPGGTR
ncbi:MAG TPA: ABC transporter substrate binding protein [Rudaea sp.]|jgi:putative ABC transport system substrate-binding protein|nr:ABC transporter substrate binding protein [Rudaea sp.]